MSQLLASTAPVGNLASLEKGMLEAFKQDGARVPEEFLNDPDLPVPLDQAQTRGAPAA